MFSVSSSAAEGHTPVVQAPVRVPVVLQLLCVSDPTGAALLFSLAAVDLQLCLTSHGLTCCAGPAERSSAQRELSATHSDAWAAPRPWLASAAGRAAQARLQLPAGQSEARAQAQGQSQWQAQPPAMRPHAGRQQSDGRFQTEQATAATSISSVGAAALPKPRRQYLDSETDRIARIMASRPKH